MREFKNDVIDNAGHLGVIENESEKIVLTRASSRFDYLGMTVVPGQWYGVAIADDNIFPAFTSGMEVEGSVKVYSLDPTEGWGIDWVPVDETEFVITNLPETLTEDQLYLLPEFAGGWSEKTREYFEDEQTAAHLQDLWDNPESYF